MRYHGYCPPSVGIGVARLLAEARMEVMRGESVDVVEAQLVAKFNLAGCNDFARRVVGCAYDTGSMFNLAMIRGYCYLWLVKPELRLSLAIELGPSPTVLALTRMQATVWDFPTWSKLSLVPGGVADFHIQLSTEQDCSGVDFIDALLYMQLVSAAMLPTSWIDAAMPKDFLCKLTLYSTIGASRIEKIDIATKLSHGYDSLGSSVEQILRHIIFRGQFAVIASLYGNGGFPPVDCKTMLTGTLGRAVVQLPVSDVDGFYVLPPGFYYIGDGFRVGSDEVVTIILVPAGLSMRICSHESRFRSDMPYPKTFSPYFRDCSVDRFFRTWWDNMHRAGDSSDGHFVRTQSDVLIHSAETVIAARGDYVEVSEPLDELKSLQLRRYQGVVSPGGVDTINCEQVADYTVLSGFRSTAAAELSVGNAVTVQESNARIALPVGFPITVSVSDSRRDNDLEPPFRLEKPIVYTFLLESVADSYSYDCEYDSDTSMNYSGGSFSPRDLIGTSNWYEKDPPPYEHDCLV